MANRHLLAINKLEDFRNWLLKNGWQIEETKGKYEVLRARKSTEKLPLIVYKKDKDGLIHLSVSDWNAKYVADFINSKKDNKSNNLQQQLDQQKAVWQKLKEILKRQIDIDSKEYLESGFPVFKNYVAVENFVLQKMQELEGEDVKD